MFELMGAVMLFTIIAAIVAIESRDLLSAVVSVTAVGFGLIVAFFYMRAPDVAIVPIVVEVLVLVILIRATLRVGLKTFIGNRDLFGMMVTLTLLAVFFVMGLKAFDSLPRFGEPAFAAIAGAPAMEYVKSGLKDTGAANMVTAVLLDYRGYDTLGEATVLFTAIIGAIAVIRRKARKEVTEPEVDEWPK
jgi:multicomponent Na+:H+ antiporter subunit B